MRRAVSIFIAGLLAVGLPLAPSSARSDSMATAEGVWFAKGGDQTMGQALLEQAVTQAAAERQVWHSVMQAMAEQSQKSSDAEATSDASALSEAADVLAPPASSSADSSIIDATTAGSLERIKAQLDDDIARLRADEAEESAKTDAIGTLSIRGGKIANGYAWQLEEIAEGFFCNPVCQLKDRIVVRYTVNPGGLTSRVDHNVFYFPSTGGFRSLQGTRSALCGGTTACGTVRGALPLGGSGSATVWNSTSQKGKRLKHRLAITTVYFPSDQTVRDEADSGSAYCVASSGDNRCRYD